MGYSYRNNGHIKDFWPDDTESTMYIDAEVVLSLQDLIDRAKEKWPLKQFKEIEISAEEIHTRCLTYDVYDPSDYDNFLILTVRS